MFHFIVETEELKGLDVDELEAVSAEKYGPGRARTRVVKPMPYPCGYCNLWVFFTSSFLFREHIFQNEYST